MKEIQSEDQSSMPFLTNIQKPEEITCRVEQPNGDNVELFSTRAFDLNQQD